MATITGSQLSSIVAAIYNKGTSFSSTIQFSSIRKYLEAETLESTVVNATLTSYTFNTDILAASTQSMVLGAGSEFNDVILLAAAGNANLTGNDNNNMFYGNEFNNILTGGLGNDTFEGAAGNDKIFGDAGNDNLSGGNGGDSLVGGDGNDTLYGGLGFDTLMGGAGNDRIEDGDSDALSGKGAYMDGGEGNDTITGGTRANDTIYGGAGNDSINGGRGADVLYGGIGDDIIRGAGNYSGGSNGVTYSYKFAVKAYGGAGNDNINISGLHVVIESDEKADLIGGNDTVIGNMSDTSSKGVINTYRGNDVITASGSGSFAIEADLAADLVGGNDTVNYSGSGTAVINTYRGSDAINLTGSGKSTVTTDLLTDTVGAVDTVNFRFGTANVKTGAGNDIVNIGGGTSDSVSGSLTLDTGNGDDVVTRINFGSVFTNFGANKILLGAGNDTVDLEMAENDFQEDVPVLDEEGNQTYQPITVLDGKFGNAVMIWLDGDGNPVLDGSDNPQYLARSLDENFNDVQVDANGLVYTFDTNAETYTDANDVVYSRNENGDFVNTNGDPLPAFFNQLFRVDVNGNPVLDGENLQFVVNHDGNGNSLNTMDLQVDDLNSPIFETIGTVAVDADFSKAKDTIDGGAGNDNIKSGGGNDSLLGGAGDDTLAGGRGRDTLDGGIGNDVLNGDSGNDTLLGGLGNDTLWGGEGSDILTGGLGVDAFIIGEDGGGIDVITDFAKTSTTVNKVTTVSSDNIFVTGHKGDDNNFTLDDFEASSFPDSTIKGVFISFNNGGSLLIKNITLDQLFFNESTDTFSLIGGTGFVQITSADDQVV